MMGDSTQRHGQKMKPTAFNQQKRAHFCTVEMDGTISKTTRRHSDLHTSAPKWKHAPLFAFLITSFFFPQVPVAATSLSEQVNDLMISASSRHCRTSLSQAQSHPIRDLVSKTVPSAMTLPKTDSASSWLQCQSN